MEATYPLLALSLFSSILFVMYATATRFLRATTRPDQVGVASRPRI